MDQILSNISSLIENNMWLGPLFALLAGMITSITPCALSSVPLIIGYVGSAEVKSTKNSFKYSLAYAIGLAITFTALGAVAAYAGSFFGRYSTWWLLFLGILMILMALQTAEIFNFLPNNGLVAKGTKKGVIGAVLLGILGGLFSSPCSTPVLVLLMGIIGSKGNLVLGLVLMLFYAAGYSCLTIVAGTSMGFVQKLKQSKRYGVWANVFKYVFAALLLLLGLYLIYEAF